MCFCLSNRLSLSLFTNTCRDPQRSFSPDLFCSLWDTSLLWRVLFLSFLILVFLFIVWKWWRQPSVQPTPLFIPLDLFFLFFTGTPNFLILVLSWSRALSFPSLFPVPFSCSFFLAMHHAVLPYCDPSALRTPCLPPDSFLLPQPCTGKRVRLSQFCIFFAFIVSYLSFLYVVSLLLSNVTCFKAWQSSLYTEHYPVHNCHCQMMR